MILKFSYLLLFFITIPSLSSQNILGLDALMISESKSLYFNPPSYPGRIFYVNLTSKLPDQDLTILTFPKTPSSQPLIILSRTPIPVTKFNSTDPEIESSIYVKCFSHGIEFCTIPEANLTANSTIYITLVCEEKCFFDLQANYHIERVVDINNMVLMHFNNKTSQIIKFTIPEKNDNSEHLLINSQLLNPYVVKEPFHIYINQGNTIPTSNSYDFKVETTWNNGKGISIDRIPIEKNKKALCFQCNYTLMIEADERSMIQIKVELYSHIREISIGSSINDIVSSHNNITFLIKIESDLNVLTLTEDIHFRLKPFSGFPILYFHMNSLPNTFGEYAYKLEGKNDEDFTLTSLDRAKLFPHVKSIYLTVYGETDSSFLLDVYVSFNNQMRIDFGVTETGVLSYKEIINYKFSLYEVKIMNFTIDLLNEVGSSNLVMKSCTNEFNCFFTYQDFLDHKNLNLTHYSSQDKTGKIHFQFNHMIENCKSPTKSKNTFEKIFDWLGGLIYHRSRFRKCTYVIGVVANNKNFTVNRFNLLLSYDNKVIDLKENQIIRNSLEIHSNNDYVFVAVNDDTLETITFQLTVISGEVAAYCSRNKSVNESSFEKRTQYDYDAIEYKRQEDSHLVGTYNLKVVALTTAYYTLTTFVSRASKNIQSNETFINETNKNQTNITHNMINSNFHAIKLYNGLTQKISYQSNYSRPTYFQVTLNYSHQDLKEIKEAFHLSLNPISGKYLMYLGLNFIPSLENSTWKSFNNSISIYPADPEFKNPCVIYIMVTNLYTANLDNYNFLVTFSSNSSILELRLGVPMQIFLMEGDVRHYSFELSGNQYMDYIFSKSVNGIHSESIQVFVSTNSSNLYPDDRNYNIIMKDSSFTLAYEETKEICVKLHFSCKIYFTVKAFENAEFSMLIKTTETEILMYDGTPIFLSILESNDPFKLYFYPPKKKTISFTTYSIFKKTCIYVNIIPFTSKETWTFPTNTSYQYSSLSHSTFDSSSLTLYESDFNRSNCNILPKGCVITIRVYPNAINYYSYMSNPHFSLVASSEITKLSPNIAHVASVKDKAYNYYSIYVNSNETIFVSLTPLSSGDPDLMVSFGYEKRPTLDNNDWMVRGFGGETLQITPNEVKEKLNLNLPGYFVIGVFGFRNCSFSISAMVGSLKFMKIFNGNPLQLSLEAKETIYLEYNHYMDDGFKIIALEEIGEVDIYINKLEKKKDFIEELPKSDNASSYKWDNTKQIHKNLLFIRNTDPNFSKFSRYLIALYSTKPAKLSLLIEVSNYTSNLQSGKTLNDYLLPYESSSYHIFSTTGNLDVTIVVYSGDPIVIINKSFGIHTENIIQQTEKKKDSKVIHMTIYNDKLSSNTILGISYNINVKSSNQLESNYSIVAVTSFHEKFLKHGSLDFTSLKTKTSQEFIFYGFYNESQKDINQTITITVAFTNLKEKNEESELKNQYDYIYPNVTFELLNAKEKVEILKQFFSGKLANYVVKAYNSKYLMKIMNFGNETMNFTVMINNAKFNTILPNNENFGLVPLNYSDNYEIYNSKGGLLLIEGFECSGKIQILSTDNYDKAMNNEFDKKTLNYIENHLILTRNVQMNHLFLSVQPYKVDSKAVNKLITNNTDNNRTANEAYYKLKSYLLPVGATSPYDNFYYNQKIKWEYNDIMLRMSFETIKNSDKSIKNEYEVIEYLYALYISDDIEILESVIHCNSPLNSKKNSTLPYLSLNYASLYYNSSIHPNQGLFNLDVGNIIETFFSTKEFHSTPLFFGIQAKILVKRNEDFLALTFLYESNQLYLSKIMAISQKQSDSQDNILIGVLLGLLIIFMGVGLFFFRRYNIIKKKLEFEVFVSKTEEISDQNHEDANSERKNYHGFADEKTQAEA